MARPLLALPMKVGGPSFGAPPFRDKGREAEGTGTRMGCRNGNLGRIQHQSSKIVRQGRPFLSLVLIPEHATPITEIRPVPGYRAGGENTHPLPRKKRAPKDGAPSRIV